MKRTFTLLGVLIAVVAIIMVANRISATREAPLLFKNFDKAKVTRISISKYGSTETLKLADKQWFSTASGDYPADTSKIGAMLTLLMDQKKDDPVSKNPAKHGELRVDSMSATRVTVEAGSNKWVFLIGSMAQGFTGNYLRFDGKNEVFVSKGGLDQVFSTAPNYYRNKTLFKLNKDEVNAIQVTYKPHKDSAMVEFAAQFSVEKTAWKIDKPEVADGDGAKINEYLAKFCSLEVDDWYDRDTTTALGFDDPMVRATLKKNDGSVVTLLAGAEKNGNRYVKVEGDNNKYLLRTFRLTALKPDIAQLKAKAGSAAGAETMPGGNAAGDKPVLGFPQGK